MGVKKTAERRLLTVQEIMRIIQQGTNRKRRHQRKQRQLLQKFPERRQGTSGANLWMTRCMESWDSKRGGFMKKAVVSLIVTGMLVSLTACGSRTAKDAGGYRYRFGKYGG